MLLLQCSLFAAFLFAKLLRLPVGSSLGRMMYASGYACVHPALYGAPSQTDKQLVTVEVIVALQRKRIGWDVVAEKNFWTKLG